MIDSILRYLLNRWENRESLKLFGAVRSTQWGKVRAAHLLKQPNCMVCGGSDNLQVHHIRPFHLHPELELDPTNFITLCEGKNCHLRFGHLYSFRAYNPVIKDDAQIWKEKIDKRPLA